MRSLRLPEPAAREVLLLRAIESEDTQGAVLTREDREYATAVALRESAPGDDRASTARFLHRRANLALDRLLSRIPALRRACGMTRWPGWVNWAVPLAALVLGFLSHRLDGERLNILAFPLLGMLAWNLLVYLWLVIAAVKRGREGHPLLGLLERIGRPATSRLAAQPSLERGVSRFARDWAKAAGRLTHYRASRTLHLGAAMFAIGIIGGMLIRARYTAEYQAGWAGTWAGAEVEVAAFLSLLFGPASWLTGIALPGAERLRDLRGGAENAGDWLILWSVTAALFVIIPRLLLALWSAIRGGVLARRVPVTGREDFYVRSLLRNALGEGGQARVVPYGFSPGPIASEKLERILVAAMGERMRVRIDEPLPYGSEDRWIAAETETLGDADLLLLLFNLASTPEAENHGAFAQSVRDRLRGGGTGLTFLLDDSSLRERLGGQASANRRLEERLAAWRQVLLPTGIEPVVIGLSGAEEADGARTLEKALQRSPVPA